MNSTTVNATRCVAEGPTESSASPVSCTAAESQNKAAAAATANKKDEQTHRSCLSRESPRLLRSQQRDHLWLLASAEDVSGFRSGPDAAVPKMRRLGKHHHTQEGGRDSITTHERTAAPPQRRKRTLLNRRM